MKANKRVRDLRRRSDRHLFYVDKDGMKHSTTTFPVDSGKKVNNIQEEPRK